MAETFSFKIEARPSGDVSFDVLTTEFGDGYTQAAANGINNKTQSWSISATGAWSGAGLDVAGIAAFIDAREGWESFNWTPPKGAAGLYRCADYSLRHLGGDIYAIAATFMDARQ